MKQTSQKVWLENLLMIVILSGYVWMIMRLFAKNKLSYYIHPDYIWMTLASAVVLLAVLVFVIISIGFREKKAALSSGLLKHPLRIIMIVFPLILFFAVEPKALSSQAFASRTTGLGNELALGKNNQAPSFVINTEKRELVDWVRLFAQNENPEDFISLKGKVSGFVLKSGDLPDGYFTVARYVISCCAADARPVGILVKYDSTKFEIKQDQWIEVRGSFEVDQIGSEHKPVLNLEEMKPIEVPDNPYIS